MTENLKRRIVKLERNHKLINNSGTAAKPDAFGELLSELENSSVEFLQKLCDSYQPRKPTSEETETAAAIGFEPDEYDSVIDEAMRLQLSTLIYRKTHPQEVTSK